jgi:DNA processing protein
MKTSNIINNYPVNTLTFNDRDYPHPLRLSKNPPSKLYYRGKWNKKLFEKSLAIVGSRRITNYGERVLDRLVPDLVAEGVTIISGFMYGVDSVAHEKTLECGGKTIAILGCGLNILYPPENEKLYGQIIETGGLVVSEYEPNQQPQLWTFPQRNRIVAGLSTLGVLVVEAGEKSGSLITARIAKKQGKKIYAIPGPITSSVSVGTNQLIKSKQAKMVLNTSDVISMQSLTRRKKERPCEGDILDMLKREPLTTDEIARNMGKNAAETSQILTILTLRGLIRENNGKYFI